MLSKQFFLSSHMKCHVHRGMSEMILRNYVQDAMVNHECRTWRLLISENGKILPLTTRIVLAQLG